MIASNYGMHSQGRKDVGQSRRFAKGKRRLATTIKEIIMSLNFLPSSNKTRKIFSIWLLE
jgi:hypothetical protein